MTLKVQEEVDFVLECAQTTKEVFGRVQYGGSITMNAGNFSAKKQDIGLVGFKYESISSPSETHLNEPAASVQRGGR